MNESIRPVVGSEAVINGWIATKHQLRAHYRAVFPDVYLPADVEATLHQRTVGAWLWSHRQAIVAGLAAAAMHGSKWVPDDVPIELISTNGRPPIGIRTRQYAMRHGETMTIDGMRITTPARTAFDIGRCVRADLRVERLDALGNATGLTVDDIRAVAIAHPGSPHVSRLRSALELYDPGAQSPKETWLRLLVIRGGFPRPQTQIPVLRADGRSRYSLDMGWPELKIAVEYDGDQHRLDPKQYAWDIARLEYLARIGWTVIRVIAGSHPTDVLQRIALAWESRLRPDRSIP